MGTELSPEALRIFVLDLAHLTDEQIMRGLERTRKEVRGGNGFAPRLCLQDVLDRAGVVSDQEMEDLEAAQAWDTALELVKRFGYWVEDKVELRPRVTCPDKKCKKCHGAGFTAGEKDADPKLYGAGKTTRFVDRVPGERPS
jgi:hypothetical protein